MIYEDFIKVPFNVLVKVETIYNTVFDINNPVVLILCDDTPLLVVKK